MSLPLAHGLVGRDDLPLPEWLFAWAAAVVLVVSFVALSVLWDRPRLQDERARDLGAGVGRLLSSRAVEVLCGAVGVALLAFTVYAGLAGEQVPTGNWAPTFVFVVFWLGLVPVQLLLGDVFRAFNPWRAIGRATGWAVERIARTRGGEAPEPLALPERVGYWPAVVGLLAFGVLELVLADGDAPRTVAVACVGYTVATLAAMALVGTERWCERGEAFGVYFGLIARAAPLALRDRRLVARRPLSGLSSWPAGPGSVALLAAMIGVVTFDGFSASSVWLDASVGPIDALVSAGLSVTRAQEVVYLGGLLLCVGLVAALYLAGARGASMAVAARPGTRALARDFAHTLVPIAVAYVAAHYASLLVFQGQAVGYLASDPLGRGDDLLGTATWTIDYAVLGATTFWYLQVAFVVVGHVGGLVLAHDRALARFSTPREATRSQLWMLGVMVAFTSLALWLLAAAKAA